ncbi:GFA family protein [Vibrio lentus]|uniref:Aldehyde-activating protein n=1 Tax=Vibrio lentus TaxID=136468 RepID=A0A2N7C560_9VIBR|nr:GFA family protein [Vibrio lentus]PME56142.1 aldehyde-activating protein [Vibrio lentus]PME69960.1 aldehyde-activating protein [Vibrio lentus]PME92825.1 aldehyde-activating protein [Vibrio lentus]PMI11988.1 aldehyde-activating protein [Vibrio lentus]PMI79341.1 aldehyde-activating protein [Vibrio lentus]
MVLGSCLCNAVQFKVTGDFKRIVNCHCNLCRKMNGAAFSTYVAVLQTDFELVTGGLSFFDVTENARKHFCGECGTPIFNSNPKYEGLTILHLGCLDLDLLGELKPDVNIYDESKVSWLESISGLPTFDKAIG